MSSFPGHPDATEQRGSPRRIFDEPVQVVAPQAAGGHMVNAAEGGFCLVLDECFEEGEGLTFSIFQDRLMLLGVVRWNRKRDGAFRHGIKLSHDDLKILKLIHKQIQESEEG